MRRKDSYDAFRKEIKEGTTLSYFDTILPIDLYEYVREKQQICLDSVQTRLIKRLSNLDSVQNLLFSLGVDKLANKYSIILTPIMRSKECYDAYTVELKEGNTKYNSVILLLFVQQCCSW